MRFESGWVPGKTFGGGYFRTFVVGLEALREVRWEGLKKGRGKYGGRRRGTICLERERTVRGVWKGLVRDDGWGQEWGKWGWVRRKGECGGWGGGPEPWEVRGCKKMWRWEWLGGMGGSERY